MCFAHSSFRTSLDSWILPWKKIIGKPLSTLFPEIRRKLAKALTSWDPQDQSAYYVIKPWQGVIEFVFPALLLLL